MPRTPGDARDGSTESTGTVPRHCCAPVRAYLAAYLDKPLLPPVGHRKKVKRFAVPSPWPDRSSTEHCQMCKYESAFENESGEHVGDYWDYAAAITGKSGREVYDRILAKMQLTSLNDITYPGDGQPWYDDMMRGHSMAYDWVEQPRRFTGEEGYGNPWMEDTSTKVRGTYDKEHEYALARDQLCSAANRCVDAIAGHSRNIIFANYQLGAILHRLKHVFRLEAAAGIVKGSWEEYLKDYSDKSSRHGNYCIRIFRAVEFPWQLADYGTLKDLLSAISEHRKPETELVRVGSGRSAPNILVTQDFDTEYTGGNVIITLGDCSAADKVKNAIIPGVVSKQREEDAELLLKLVDRIAADCFDHRGLVKDLEPVYATMSALMSTFGSGRAEFLKVLRTGLRTLDEAVVSEDHRPTWYQLLMELHRSEEARVTEVEVAESYEGTGTDEGYWVERKIDLEDDEEGEDHPDEV